MKKAYLKNKLKNFDWVSLIPTAIFLIITAGFWGLAPVMDPMVIFRESTMFFATGFEELSKTGYTIHPPLIYILNSIGFVVLGKTTLTYNIVGFLIFTFSSVYFYHFLKRIYNRKMALISTVLIYCNPLTVVNAFYLGNDFLVLTGTLLSLSFLLDKRYILLTLTLGAMMLMKETAMLVVGSIAILIGLQVLLKFFKLKDKLKSPKKLLKIFLPLTTLILPFIFFVLWRMILAHYGMTEWKEVSIIQTENSSFELVLDNIFKLKLFNKFLAGNLLNLFVYHFQWVYVLILAVLFIFKAKVLWKLNKNQKVFLFSLLFTSTLYILLVLSFPTHTVIRYSLPVYPAIFILIAIFASQLKNVMLSIFFLMIITVITLSTFTSLDPVTNALNKGELRIYGINFYNTSYWFNGTDRITYNRQIFDATKKQEELIKNILESDADVFIAYCDNLKLGEKLYSIGIYNEFYPQFSMDKNVRCLNVLEIERDAKNLNNQYILVLDYDLEDVRKRLEDSGVEGYKITVMESEYRL